jgi:hypothetical protein
MGRTLPTITQTIEFEKEAWKHFRRTLRKEDQDAFDAVWRMSRYHAAAISMASRPVPFDALVMSMLVGLAREIMNLKEGKPEKSKDDIAREPHGTDRGMDI